MAAPHVIFKSLFQFKKIKKAYEDNISKKATRGIDKVGVKVFNRNKNQYFKIIYDKCNRGNYKFSPFVQKLQVKGKDRNPREISISTIRDRIVLYQLKEFLHEIFPECVNRKLPNNYIREIKELFECNDLDHFCYVKIDIKSFYDNIDHEILLNILKKRIKSKKILDLLIRSIKTPTVPINYKRIEKNEYKRKLGIAQGLSISNILANIYFKELDDKLKNLGAKYFRYVDDILIFIADTEPEPIKDMIEAELKKYKLEVNEQKTNCHLAGHTFEYLGYKLSLPKVSIRESNVERFITSIASKFALYAHNTESQLKKYSWLTREMQKQVLVEDLNERITGALSDNKRYGWLFYFVEINDIQLLHKLDSIISKFFAKFKDFNYSTPPLLKKLSKAYYKVKYDPYGGYIHNYAIYASLREKIKYLSNRGYLNPKGRYKKEDIEIIFNRIKRKRLTDLENDVGLIS